MRSLSSLGSKQLKHRKGRSLLTSIGITLGVAILFGVLVSNDTTNEGFKSLIEDFTGRADVIVTPTGSFDSTLPSSIAAKIENLPQVTAAVGRLPLRTSVKTPKVTEPEDVRLVGIDLEGERKIRNFTLQSGRFFAPEAREITIPAKLASKLGLKLGAQMPAATPVGIQQLKIVGILKDMGAARVGEGGVGFTSIETARRLDERGDEVRVVSVVLEDGVKVDSWIKKNKSKIGAGVDVENAATLAQGFLSLLKGIQGAFTSFAGIALFVGAFLIYLTLTSSIIERTKVLGTLRALGATRGQIRRMVVREALVLGFVSSLFGLAVGLGIARGLLILISKLFEVELKGLTIRPIAVAASVGIGVVVTLVSSLIPARKAGRLRPVEAVRGPGPEAPRLSKSWIVGLVLIAAGFAVDVMTENAIAGAAGTGLTLLGAVLLTPLLLRPAAALLGVMTKRLARGGGDIAVLHLVKERSRSAYTLALIMVVMAMIFANGAVEASISGGVGKLLDRVYGADMIVHANEVRFTPEVEGELRSIPQVKQVASVAFSSTFIKRKPKGKEGPTFVLLIDPRTYFQVESLDMSDASLAEAIAGLKDGDILISKSLAEDSGKSGSDSIQLKTLQGNRDFKIAAIYGGLFGPDIIMGTESGDRYLGGARPSEFHLNLEQGVSIAAAKGAINRKLGSRYNLQFQTLKEIKDEAKEQIGRFTNIFLAILLVAAIIGLLGLANTLAMSVAQRSRETGVLRAVGATKGQVARMVLTESTTLGLVAFALSIPLGLLLSLTAVREMGKAIGFPLDYVFPGQWIAIIAAFGLVASSLAALVPARRAARIQVVEALRFE